MPKPKWLWELKQVIPNEGSECQRVVEEIVRQLADRQWGEHDLFGVRLALDEAVVNAMKHGNRHDASKRVRVACKVSDDRLWVEVADEGPGFDPAEVPDCREPENLERPCGRGIMLMRCFMSRVEYNAQGNVVVMEKERPAQAEKSDAAT